VQTVVGAGVQVGGLPPDQERLRRSGGQRPIQPERPGARHRDGARTLPYPGQGEDPRGQSADQRGIGGLLVQLRVRIGRRGGGPRAGTTGKRHTDTLAAPRHARASVNVLRLRGRTQPARAQQPPDDHETRRAHHHEPRSRPTGSLLVTGPTLTWHPTALSAGVGLAHRPPVTIGSCPRAALLVDRALRRREVVLVISRQSRSAGR